MVRVHQVAHAHEDAPGLPRPETGLGNQRAVALEDDVAGER
jgi:hypothetical protein